MLFKPLKRIAQIIEHEKYMESHSPRNVHDVNPYPKKMEMHLQRMCMTKTNIQRNGSHSHRNVQDENQFKKNMESHLHRIYMTKTNSKQW